MFTTRHHYRPHWVALLAIVGTVWVSDMATACSPQPSKPTRSCCVNASTAGCTCCSPKATAQARAPEAFTPPARSGLASTLTSSGESCECRLSEPAAPANGPRPHSTTEDRDEPVPGEFFSLVVAPDRLPASPDRSPSPNASPPDFPLYLRTSRFLI